jgi:hypothetical protein
MIAIYELNETSGSGQVSWKPIVEPAQRRPQVERETARGIFLRGACESTHYHKIPLRLPSPAPLQKELIHNRTHPHPSEN